jgi:hypothetical protein
MTHHYTDNTVIMPCDQDGNPSHGCCVPAPVTVTRERDYLLLMSNLNCIGSTAPAAAATAANSCCRHSITTTNNVILKVIITINPII